MNWYKVSFPITEKEHPHHYTDIAHPKYDNWQRTNPDDTFVLWVINDKWHFSKKQLQGKSSGFTHGYLREKGYFNWNSVKASGRYDPQKQIASLTLHKRYPNPKMNEYIIKKITQILDKEFDNPAITLYD